MRFWDYSYKCFTFSNEDLVPTIEEYSILMGVKLQHSDKVYVRKPRSGCWKKLAKILGVRPQIIDTDLGSKRAHVVAKHMISKRGKS